MGRSSLSSTLDIAYLVDVVTHNTNGVKLYSILKMDNPKSQLCYYQEPAFSNPSSGYRPS